MAFPDLNNLIETSVDQSMQAKPKEGAHLITWLVRAGMSVYPWWSPSRDIQLRKFWKTSDHLAGAIYTLETKMSSIPVQVRPRDPSIREHVKQARQTTAALLHAAEWGEGWVKFFERWVEELCTQDNGVFAEVIGNGPPDGALVGAPFTVKIMDSSRCQRTGHPIYPVVYLDVTGKRYKVHYSRVIYTSQMSSPIADMFGVGFCAVSRAINIAQTLIDILTYKAEKMGSRPHREILVTRGGLDPEQVREAFTVVDSALDAQGLSRYSRIAVVGSSSLPESSIESHDLASLPDGFDEQTSTILGMATIALALGLDARELFPALTSGATRADALLMHLKQRGKAPGQIIQTTEQLFNFKFLPPYLELVFDFQDDEQDRQTADTKEVRSRRWRQAMDTGSMDVRTMRQQMLEVGDLSEAQYEALELSDGRLPDGTSVLALFFSKDRAVKELIDLDIGEFNPFDASPVDAENLLPAIGERMAEIGAILVNSPDPDKRRLAQHAQAALKALQKQLAPAMPEKPPPKANEGDGLPERDPRMRRRNPFGSNREETLDVNEQLVPDSDDRLKEAGETGNFFS